jgi:hypothetical protein
VEHHLCMSALPQKADMCSAIADVRFVPIADIRHESVFLKQKGLLAGLSENSITR